MVMEIETALAQEAATPRGYNVPLPDPGQAGGLTADLRGSKGRLNLVPSVASDVAWGQGHGDRSPLMIGFLRDSALMPPQAMVELRSPG